MKKPSSYRPTTRLGIQAVAALLVISAFSTWLDLPRSNWAYMAAISVLCQTWGESLRKSGQRILATIGGLTAGVLLHELFGTHYYVELGAITLFLFLMTYYMVISYAAGMFFLSVMLALMFGVMGASVEQLYWQRIAATLVGGAVALLISMVVLPTRTRVELRRSVKAYLDVVSRSYRDGIEWLLNPDAEQPADWPAKRRQQFTQLRQQYTVYLNEAAIRRAPANEMKVWMYRLEFMHLYQSQFEHMVFGNRRNPETQVFRSELQELSARVAESLQGLAALLDHPSGPVPLNVEQATRSLVRSAMQRRAAEASCSRSALLDVLPIFYFSWKMTDMGRPGTGASPI